MWIPRSIQFTNLLSHSNTSYNFKKESLTIVEGENKVSEGTVNNGAGKSTLFEAIVLALDGTIYRKVGREEFIKFGNEECVVDFIMDNDVLKKSFKIHRILHITKSAKLKLYFKDYDKDWIELKDISSINEGNKKIYDIIGIQKTDIENFFIISQGNKNSFFTAGDIKQKEIISRFSNFTILDKIEEDLKSEIYKLESKLLEKKFNIDKHVFIIDKYKEELKEIKENFEEEKKQQILDLKERKETLDNKLVIYANKWSKNMEEGETLSEDLEMSKGAIIDTSKIESDITDLQKQRSALNKEIISANQELKKMKISTAEFIECPGCNKRFIPDSDLTPEELTKHIKSTESLIKEKESKITALKSKIQEKEAEGDEAHEILTIVRHLESRIRINEENRNNIEEERKALKKNLETIDKKLKEVEKLTVNERVKSLKIKIDTEQNNITVDKLDLEKIDEQISSFKLQQFHFSKKGFKTFLANKSIRTIQDICNFYLKRFENNLQVEISGYKVLKNDEVRDKIDVSIYMDGISSGNFNRYSGGEKSRVELVGIIAINRLINNGCEHGKGLDLLVLDEYVDALDIAGAEELVKILSKCKITSLVILQKMDKLIEHPNVIKVIKNENGSFIKN